MRTTRYVTAIMVIAALLCSAACGSGSSGSPATTVSGSVANGDEYTKVTFTPDGGGTPTELACDASGNYSGSLASGLYDVVASRPGYDDDEQTGVDVVASADTATDLTLAAMPANEYIGSEACATCHQDYYERFRRTGHPYKINEVIDDMAPSYPFSALPGDIISRIADDGADIGGGATDPNGTQTDNPEGTPADWSEVSYVIGGYFWKARFIDLSGWIVTGTETQYNFATDGMVAYHNNEGYLGTPPGVDDKTPKPFNCGNCHTTGWKHYDASDNPFRQQDMAGMDGTFHAGGIQCEACHGAGSTHAQTQSDSDITLEAMPRTEAQMTDGSLGYGLPIACGECHTRDGEADYPGFVSAYNLALDGAAKPRVAMGGRIAASGGLVKHHEQYDELLGVDPDTLDSTRSGAFMSTHGNCTTCHEDKHNTTVNQHQSGDPVGANATNADCMVCHADYDPNLASTAGMKGLNCIDCHMPKMAKSAVATTLGNGVVVGDVSSHIFGIDLSTGATQINGSFANPYITVDWACRVCHGNNGLFDVSASDTYEFHTNVPD